MSDKFYIHIGAPKTGSTALQYYLAGSRERLRAQGLLYPEGASRAGGHHDVAFLLGGGYPEWAVRQDKPLPVLLDELRGEFCGYTGNAVISSENFSLFPAPGLLRDALHAYDLVAGRTCKVIVYVRSQVEAHESWYNQLVKAQGFAGVIADSIHANWRLWDYAALLEPWAVVFGEGNIIVREYGHPDGARWNILADAGEVMGFSVDAETVPGMPNTGLDRDTLEFQRILNQLPVSTREKRVFHKQLMALVQERKASGLRCDPPLLTDAMRQEILSGYASSNAEAAARYLGRKRLFQMPATGELATGTYKGLEPEVRVLIARRLMACDVFGSSNPTIQEAIRHLSEE